MAALIDLADWHERRHLETALRYVADWRCAVDGGAHRGIFTRVLAERFAHVHAFEPVASNAERVPALSNVRVWRLALADRLANVALAAGPSNTGQWHVAARDEAAQDSAHTLTLDSLALGSLGFLKLDVEGYEWYALRGAEQTVRRHRPVVMIEENGGGARYGVAEGEAGRLLASWGYRRARRIGHNEVWVPQECSEPDDGLVVAVPSGRHFGLMSMGAQIASALGARVVNVADVPDVCADAVRGRTLILPMLDGVLPDYREQVEAATLAAGRIIWVPMSEYLDPQGLVRYRRFDLVVPPTRQAHEWLTERGVGSILLPWAVPAASVRPQPGAERRILHFSYGDRHSLQKGGTDLVLAAWPALRDAGLSLTIQGRGPIRGAPADVEVIEDRTSDLDTLWAAHGILLQPYRRAGIGLPVLEAAARGLVALTTAGTAAAEFVPPEWRLTAKPGQEFKAVREMEADAAAFAGACAAADLNQAQAWADRQRQRFRAWHDLWTRTLTKTP